MSDKINKLSAETDVLKHCFGNNLNEIQRHFKRLKVDESDKPSNNLVNGSKSDYPYNYFSFKSSPYPPKICFFEKRQTINGFRRQRLHLVNKTRHNSENISKTEEECVAKLNDFSFHTDFSQLKSNSSFETKDNSKYLYFNKDFKTDSNKWRNNLLENNEKMCKNSDISNKSKVKSTKNKNLCFKDDKTCARQAMDSCDASADELAAYLDDTLFLPRKMSFMAEMMYT